GPIAAPCRRLRGRSSMSRGAPSTPTPRWAPRRCGYCSLCAPAGMERMFGEIGTPAQPGIPAPPLTSEDVARLLSVAAKYQFEVRGAGMTISPSVVLTGTAPHRHGPACAERQSPPQPLAL